MRESFREEREMPIFAGKSIRGNLIEMSLLGNREPPLGKLFNGGGDLRVPLN